MTIKHIELHTIINHLPQPVLVGSYLWRGVLWYTYAISAAHMGVEEQGPATIGKFIEELERITSLVAQDFDMSSKLLGKSPNGSTAIARAKM